MSSPQSALAPEMDLAARVQASLLPKPGCCFAGWRTAFSYQPAQYVSGDYVDLIEAGPDAFHFIFGDVSGKGVAAALLMAHLHATIRALFFSQLTLAEVVRQTSSMFCQSSLPAQFVTLVVGTATRSGKVQFINAGHTPVLLLRGNAVEVLSATEVPLGLFCQPESSPVPHTLILRLSKGDILLLYSDGVSETTNAEGDEFGVERLQTALAISTADPQTTINTILTDVQKFSSAAASADDRTLLVMKYGKQH